MSGIASVQWSGGLYCDGGGKSRSRNVWFVNGVERVGFGWCYGMARAKVAKTDLQPCNFAILLRTRV